MKFPIFHPLHRYENQHNIYNVHDIDQKCLQTNLSGIWNPCFEAYEIKLIFNLCSNFFLQQSTHF